MNTRTAPPGAALRQERWASSSPEQRGLLANLVSSQNNIPSSIKWFVQWRSWQPGGLEALAGEILEEGSYRLTRRNHGRPEILLPEDVQNRLVELANCPNTTAPALLVERLKRICEVQKARAFESIAHTKVVASVHAGLDRCNRSRFNGLFIGPARSGKSTAARAWCMAQCGMARMVDTPPGNDMDSLLRAVAASIGSASGFSFKARQVEERIFSAVRGSKLTLVFDNAHLLWPQGDVRQSHPKRLQWLVSLMDATTVCLIATHQWAKSRREFIGATGWAIEQMEGRLGAVEELPDYDEDDCGRIVRFMFPAADQESEAILNKAVLSSKKRRRLGALDAAAADAVANANANGRAEPELRDVLQAAKAVIATEATLAKMAGPTRQQGEKGGISSVAAPQLRPGSDRAAALQPPSRRHLQPTERFHSA